MNKMIGYIKDILDSRASPCFGRAACAIIIAVHLVLFLAGNEKDIPWGWVSCIAVLFGAVNVKEIAIGRM